MPTVAIISSAGMMPLSTMMTTRGKFVCGNTDDGVCSAETTPARHNVAAMNVMDSACLVANRPRVEVWVMGVRTQKLYRRPWTEEWGQRSYFQNFSFRNSNSSVPIPLSGILSDSFDYPHLRLRRQAINADGHNDVARLESWRGDFNPAVLTQPSLHRLLHRLIAPD